MRTRSLALFLVSLLALLLLLCPPSLWAKPKIAVRVRVSEGIGKYSSQDSLNKYNSPVAGPLPPNEIFYYNVTVFSDNTQAVAVNNGEWCIKGEADLTGNDYHGTLSGSDLEIEFPQKNGKIKKMSFVIYDRKWRKLADI